MTAVPIKISFLFSGSKDNEINREERESDHNTSLDIMKTDDYVQEPPYSLRRKNDQENDEE